MPKKIVTEFGEEWEPDSDFDDSEGAADDEGLPDLDEAK